MKSSSRSSSSRSRSGWRRGLRIGLLTLAGVILLVFFAGSPIAKAVVNRKLGALDGYFAHVDMLRLELWRGRVEVGDFILYEREHLNEAPLIRTERASLAISWRALWQGKIGGRARVESPQVTLVKREATPEKNADEKKKKREAKEQEVAETQAKIRRWQEVLTEAFPMELSSFEIQNGSVRFLDRTHAPQVDIALESIQLLATDLTNRPEGKDGALPAKLEMQGITTGHGKLKVTAQADPLAKQPRFATSFELKDMDLPAFNSFLLAYSDADVSRGTFEIFVEVNAANGAYEGYIKPFFKDLDFKNPSDKDKNVAQRVKEKVISAVTSVLKNDEEKKVATKAPFAGNFADNQVDVWTTIVNLLRNAFVQGLRGGFEGQPTPKPASSGN